MLKKIIFLLLTALSPFLYADTSTTSASHKAAALKLLEVTKSAELLDQTTSQMTGMFAAMTQRPDITPKQKETVQAYEKKATEMLKNELTWDKLKDEFTALYVDVYTEPELVGLTRFYETPLGQKMLAKTPELMMKSMQVSQKHVQVLIPKMQALMMQMGKDLSLTPQTQAK